MKATMELEITANEVAVGPDRRWVPALMKMLPVPKPAAEQKASTIGTSILSVSLRQAANICQRPVVRGARGMGPKPRH